MIVSDDDVELAIAAFAALPGTRRSMRAALEAAYARGQADERARIVAWVARENDMTEEQARDVVARAAK